jgi:hypothetical protein
MTARAPARSRRGRAGAVRRAALAALAGGLGLAALARAEWMQPDPTYREAQFLARMAARDTAGHGNDAARLDSLGAQLLKLARLDEAETVYRRALAADPADAQALAALGKIALFRDRPAEAEALLERALVEPGAAEDLFAARVRQGKWEAASQLAGEAREEGRAELLRALAETPPYQITAGPAETKVPWVRAHPIPLVRVRLNGESMLMAVDTGAGDLLIDPSVVRRTKVRKLPGQRRELWTGSRVVVDNAIVQRLEIGGMRIEHLPAGVLGLRRWSIEVNPYGETVAGVIGLELLRRFTPTIDYRDRYLVLRREGTAPALETGAQRVPFEIWGDRELMVYGSIAGGRRMALLVQTGVPGCGIGAPQEVFDEVGVRAGMLSRVAKGAGQFLQGRPWSGVLVPNVTIGPVGKDKVQGWSGALDPSELWRHGVRRDAIVSGDVFRDWRVTIDWKARELVIET